MSGVLGTSLNTSLKTVATSLLGSFSETPLMSLFLPVGFRAIFTEYSESASWSLVQSRRELTTIIPTPPLMPRYDPTTPTLRSASNRFRFASRFREASKTTFHVSYDVPFFLLLFAPLYPSESATPARNPLSNSSWNEG